MASHSANQNVSMTSSTFTNAYGGWETQWFDVFAFDSLTVFLTLTVATASQFNFAVMAAPASLNKADSTAGWPVLRADNGNAVRDEVIIPVSALSNGKGTFTLDVRGLSRIKIQGKSNDNTGSGSVAGVIGQTALGLNNIPAVS